MSTAQQPVANLLQMAAEARRAGRLDEARRCWMAVLDQEPNHGPSLNALGLLALRGGDSRIAVDYFTRATAADPGAPPLWLNLAEAYRQAGEPEQEIASLDRALALDAYLLPALLRKAQALERLGRLVESAAVYRGLLAASGGIGADLPAPLRQALEHGRRLVEADNERMASRLAEPVAAVYEAYKDWDLRRARGYVEHRSGRRKVYQQQPVDGHFPYLPALEFFDRDSFPWFETLERATETIREELLSVWDESADGFAPYVTFGPTDPVNQWAELNHSPRWSAYFLWKDGVKQEDNCARCPRTAALVEGLPLLDIPGKAPTVMFSILDPRTRIPPHTGSSNVRTTVHLPLVLPEGCGFRVGSDTREWRMGEAWAFDDTIEHEAWNDSDRPRAILILDSWNPLLTEAEKAVVRAVG